MQAELWFLRSEMTGNMMSTREMFTEMFTRVFTGMGEKMELKSYAIENESDLWLIQNDSGMKDKMGR